MHPDIVKIGPLTIHSFGLMMAIAFLVGYYILTWEVKRRGDGEKLASDLIFWAAIGGIIGAKLFSVFENFGDFLSDPIHTLFSGSGFVFHGGLMGGTISVIIILHIYKKPIGTYADIAGPIILIGQGIGRIGCFFNGDAHGYPTTMPWGLIYSPESIAGQIYPGLPLHPTQLYEMVLNLIIFGVLWKLRKKLNVNGHLFLLYVILYSAARIFVEHFRADKLTYFGNYSAAQTIGVIGIVLGVTLMFYLKKNFGTAGRSKSINA